MAAAGALFFNHQGLEVGWQRRQHLFLAVDESRSIVACDFEIVAVRDRVCRAGLDAIAAENTTRIVDVVNACVTLSAADTALFRIFCSFDVDAIRWAGRRTKETGHTLLKLIFVALQYMHAAKAFFKNSRTFWIYFRHGWLEHLLEGDAHTLGHGGRVVQNFVNQCHFRVLLPAHPVSQIPIAPPGRIIPAGSTGFEFRHIFFAAELDAKPVESIFVEAFYAFENPARLIDDEQSRHVVNSIGATHTIPVLFQIQ